MSITSLFLNSFDPLLLENAIRGTLFLLVTFMKIWASILQICQLGRLYHNVNDTTYKVLTIPKMRYSQHCNSFKKRHGKGKIWHRQHLLLFHKKQTITNEINFLRLLLTMSWSRSGASPSRCSSLSCSPPLRSKGTRPERKVSQVIFKSKEKMFL